MERSRPSTFWSSECTSISWSESPPKSKKLSAGPTWRFSTCRQILEISRSSLVTSGGEMTSGGAICSGSGRTRRSTLPLRERGSESISTKADGTMYSGK